MASKEMAINVKMLMNARNVSLVNVTVALVRTHGVDMTASVRATFCT